MNKVVKRSLLALSVFFVGVVAFYGTHYYFFSKRVDARLAENPEYQRLLQQERAAASAE